MLGNTSNATHLEQCHATTKSNCSHVQGVKLDVLQGSIYRMRKELGKITHPKLPNGYACNSTTKDDYDIKTHSQNVRKCALYSTAWMDILLQPIHSSSQWPLNVGTREKSRGKILLF